MLPALRESTLANNNFLFHLFIGMYFTFSNLIARKFGFYNIFFNTLAR